MKLVEDYLDRSQCDTIKGFFILMVFVSHFMQYVAKAGGHTVNLLIGQCMVAPFLFYSGYGVMESIKSKGIEYINAMPRRRILTTLVNFDIAVFLFVVVNMLICNSISTRQVLLSLIGWDSVGNSNWYIFVIILCYAIAYISEGMFKRRYVRYLLFAIALLLLPIFKPSYWYDTMLCFLVGMIYSEKKKLIERLCKRHWATFFSASVVVASLLLCHCPSLRGVGSNVKAVAFVMAIVLFTMRIPIRNVALQWCGQHLFPLYIYQRIPMIILFAFDPLGFSTWRMLIYLAFSLIVTILIAIFYPKWQIKL